MIHWRLQEEPTQGFVSRFPLALHFYNFLGLSNKKLNCFLLTEHYLIGFKGTTVPTMAGHLMEHIGLSGPMLTVDTGCSSSLSAMEMAVNDLRAGKCQFALVTGKSI